MESKALAYSQLFLRIAVSACFLSAVADRLGIWGAPGDAGVAWGNWENFIHYSNSVNSFVSPGIGRILALVATSLEILLSVLLLLGYKTRFTALASGTLLLCFALAMTISFGIKSPLDYSVWTGAAGCFLLSALPSYSYSIDHAMNKNK
jgi:putative oxidoreductase